MKKKLYLIIVLFVFSAASYSQINGNITDGKGLPLPGVNIVAQGSSGASAISDFDGNFTINVEPGTMLTMTMIGFKTATAAASEGMSVVMTEEASQLEEVVVIGYGTKKAGSITGSVAQVKAADIVKTPAQSAVQAIQGRVAGINIVATDDPGSKPTVMIRGLSTLMGDRNPLYIVDGVETSSDIELSPGEIATMDILKDASSLAIYGQKGSNGVIIITTKKGRSGQIKVNYDTYYGIKDVQKKVKMADSFRYGYYNNSALGNPNYWAVEQPYNTDWFDEITRTGEVISNYLSLSGGNENATYYFGATNYKEKGILDGTDYERTNVNSRNEFKFWDNKVKIMPSVNFSIINNVERPNSAFTTAYKQAPVMPVRFGNGRWGVPLRDPNTGLVDINGSDRFNNVGNPVADLALTNNKSRTLLAYGSIGAELSIIKELKFTSNFGAYYSHNKNFNYSSNQEVYLARNPTKEIVDFEASFGENPIIYNTLNQQREELYEWNWDNYLTYNDTFGKHEVTATLGMSRTTKGKREYLRGTRYNVPEEENYWALDFSTFNNEINPGVVVEHKRFTPIVSLAYFARGDYEFDGKYLLTASVRREGTSGFQSDKRWAVFPAVSAGWVISNEEFMKGSSFFDYLKLRAGYGELGNARVANSTNLLVFASGFNYAFSSDQVINAGNAIPYEVDPNLTWETVKEIDLGLDFRIISNKLSGTIDLYSRESDDLVVPVEPPDVISPGAVTLNAGSVSNKGVEVSLRWTDDINENLNYYVSGNYSYNENKLTEVTNSLFADFIGGDLGNGGYTKQVIVGQPLGTFFVYEVTGYNSVGQFTYSAERVAAGSYIPKFTYGLSVGVNWRKFDFSVDMYGVGGNKIFNGKRAQRFGGENIEYDYLDSFWTPSTPNATNPYPSYDIPVASTYFLEDGDFLRINNITVGYTLPKLVKQIEKVRVYVTATNPFVFTNYSGYSPEIAADGNPLGRAGVELDAYPTNKTFLFGLNVSL